MKKIGTLTIGMLIFFSLGYSQPKVELGMKVTRFMMAEIWTYGGATWDMDVFYELYWGMSGELVIDFTKNICLRLEALELKNYDRGGVSIDIFSNLDADLIIVLPIGRRFSPLVYSGFCYERFWNKPVNDYRSLGPGYEWHVGLGAQYKLRKKVNLFLEIEVYTKYQTEYRRVPLEDMVYSVSSGSLGVGRINFGTRLEL